MSIKLCYILFLSLRLFSPACFLPPRCKLYWYRLFLFYSFHFMWLSLSSFFGSIGHYPSIHSLNVHFYTMYIDIINMTFSFFSTFHSIYSNFIMNLERLCFYFVFRSVYNAPAFRGGSSLQFSGGKGHGFLLFGCLPV